MYNMYRIHVWEPCLPHPEPSPLGRGHKRARLLEATEPREGAPHVLTIVKCPEGHVYGSTVSRGSPARHGGVASTA